MKQSQLIQQVRSPLRKWPNTRLSSGAFRSMISGLRSVARVYGLVSLITGWLLATATGGPVWSAGLGNPGTSVPGTEIHSTTTLMTLLPSSAPATPPTLRNTNSGLGSAPGSDLTLMIYVQSSTLYGTSPVNVVVDVSELNGVTTNGTITVYVTRDAKISLTLPASTTSVGGRPVQNSAWTLDDTNPSYYVLTTNQRIVGGGTLSFGLTGTFTAGATAGSVSISSTIPVNSVEQNVANNIDVEKIEYFP